MLSFRRHLLLILLLLAGIADVQARNGQSRNQAPVSPPPARQSAAAQPPDPSDDTGLPDSVRRVEKETGGEVLRAEPMQASGREVYRIKVLTPQGRIREVRDDPRRHGKDKDRHPASSDSEDDDERSQ